jgi:hypothetical protein
MAGIEPIGTPQVVASATEARLARLEQLLESISATLTTTTDEPPASPAGGSRQFPADLRGGREQGGRYRGAVTAAMAARMLSRCQITTTNTLTLCTSRIFWAFWVW